MVTVHASTIDDVKSRLTGIVDPTVVDRQLDLMTTGQLASAMFSWRAVVVEGTTESAIFYGIGDRESPVKLEAEGIAVVSANGKNSVPLAHAVLDSLCIPTYAVFDADSGFESRAGGKTADQIAAERTEQASRNRKLLKYFSRTEEDFPKAVVADNIAIFDDHLEAFLTANWPEWVAACADVEAAAGLKFNKNQLAYRIATLAAEGAVPEMFEQILEKVRAYSHA